MNTVIPWLHTESAVGLFLKPERLSLTQLPGCCYSLGVSMTDPSPELTTLRSGIAKLMPLLSLHGFLYDLDTSGSSSGGRYAAVTLKRNNLEIGLIVRSQTKLGCPNYSLGHGYAGHASVMTEIDSECKPRLACDEFHSYIAVDGGDPFDALKSDLERYFLPLLSNDPDALDAAITRAVRTFQRELNGNGG